MEVNFVKLSPTQNMTLLIARDKKLMSNGTHPLLLEVSWRRAGLIVRCQLSRMKERSERLFSPA